MDIDMDASTPGAGVDQQYAGLDPAQGVHISPEDGRKQLDLVFVQDCTGSQGSYISSATKNIEEICANIFESGKLQRPEDLRVGLVAYRDHPPQDHTYITKNFGFSSDTRKVHDHLKSLYASGGGDGPEAVTAALWEALSMDWREHASKMVVLIADAPPHGIGEYGDGFDEGSPDGHDPLVIARQMAARGITLFFVACEPALSGYSYATDFFQALTSITSGLMLPLTTANLLSHAIIGSVLENLDMERLIREVGQAVAERILGGNESVDDVARELHEKLLLRNESTKKVIFENIYRDSEEAKHNVQVFQTAPNLAAARPLLKKVKGTRFTDKYLAVRHSMRTDYSSSYRRPAPAASPPASPPAATTTHKIASDFAAFSAPSASVFGTAVTSSPFAVAGSKAAFSGIRGGRSAADMDDDDDDTERDAVSGIGMREDSITLEQAKRIALQSAWRGTRGG
ncbi:elongation factor-2 kinase [Auricularia subglabra TFB-10046 SS5]|nr:elongation factor-2 kinase [Auricularia subglabra TFB-10046 SS5]